MNKLVSPKANKAYILLVAALAVTGLAQMPIFKRYYIADIPGLAWTANYGFTHLAHYLLAALLLAWLAYLGMSYLLLWKKKYALTILGWTKTLLMSGIVLTGILRVIKNSPDMFFSPTATMLVDWFHLGLVILLGLAALTGKIRGNNSYIRLK